MQQPSELLRDDPLLTVLFENCSIGVIILNAQCRPVFMNRQLLEFLNLTSVETMSLPENIGSCCDLMRKIEQIRRDGFLSNDIIRCPVKATKNSAKWLQLNGSRIQYAGQPLYLLFFTDITTVKQREVHSRELLSLDLATGTINKAGLIEVIKKHLRAEKALCYSLCMIDFDHFKRLNDCYGHLFGDSVLKKFSDISRKRIREGDILGRYGGEEFVFIFDNADERQSAAILERIHSELTHYFAGMCTQPVTFSAGIVTVGRHSPAMSYKELLQRADQLLYEAKRLGRAMAISPMEKFLFTQKAEKQTATPPN